MSAPHQQILLYNDAQPYVLLLPDCSQSVPFHHKFILRICHTHLVKASILFTSAPFLFCTCSSSVSLQAISFQFPECLPSFMARVTVRRASFSALSPSLRILCSCSRRWFHVSISVWMMASTPRRYSSTFAFMASSSAPKRNRTTCGMVSKAHFNDGGLTLVILMIASRRPRCDSRALNSPTI